ncbi:MAG: His/Gly/Thr/Pro-type tRNA ligase C-terminal domain-containing protein, partial [Pseudomonadota bacterium]
AKLKAAGLRVDSDLRNEKINYKVREHSLAKVPHLLVVGKREAEEGTVAVRQQMRDFRQRVLAHFVIDLLVTKIAVDPQTSGFKLSHSFVGIVIRV